MRNLFFYTLFFIFLAAPLCAQDPSDVEIIIDGTTVYFASGEEPGDLPMDPEGGLAAIDIVGGTETRVSGFGRAKGNSYQVDTSTSLVEAEFWLDFNISQKLTFYVFEAAVEFGRYNEIYRDSRTVSGVGAGWYSSGQFYIVMHAGMHYIVAVSWDDLLAYYFNAGASQPTTFGSHTHGFAVGIDPLPSGIDSLSDDFAIYYQRLTTDIIVAVEESSWGQVKALYR